MSCAIVFVMFEDTLMKHLFVFCFALSSGTVSPCIPNNVSHLTTVFLVVKIGFTVKITM